jgi:hypothetical protein
LAWSKVSVDLTGLGWLCAVAAAVVSSLVATGGADARSDTGVFF